MAKQKGILPIVGTIGGFNFYYLDGKPVVRVAGGGFNGEAIKTQARMQRVRENGSEFGHCSQVNKVFRQALYPFYAGHKFRAFHSRLMRLFTSLKALDTTSVRGERQVVVGVNTTAGTQLLCDFEYTPDCPLQTVFPVSLSMDWGTYTLTLTPVNASAIRFSPGATHMALQFGVLDFNFNTLDYQMYLADAVMLSKTSHTSTIHLTPNSIPHATATQLAICGVRFYQDVAGELVLLNGRETVGFGVVGFQ
ncbi:hypothetical protein FNB79_10805 [Formosa sediminum]|uniref:Uncharacterized protein n=1 Tax=Formosa sediminum TaxID=2594004 RepID=A0A516GSD7_9FLAO|nr:hypothetical protein [Formosa sediminum]QDO94431.1 hypothetical protein FNB79_10805 [Formosa sediminum]